jgi:hypothetical protein
VTSSTPTPYYYTQGAVHNSYPDMDLNLNKIDADLIDGEHPASLRLVKSGGTEPVKVTTEDEKLDDMAIAEAVADVEAELKKSEKKQLPDYLWFNVAFLLFVVAFWLKFFKFV